MKQESRQEPFDIVIVGGAMTGSCLALGLSKLSEQVSSYLKRPLRLALIESHRANSVARVAHSSSTQHCTLDKNPPAHSTDDVRAIALSHGSITELKKIDVWREIADLATKIEHISISDHGHFGMTNLNAQALNVPYLGQVIELKPVTERLFSLVQASSIKLFCPAKLASIRFHQDEGRALSRLTLADGTSLDTKLVVAADGTHSQVRQLLAQEGIQPQMAHHSFAQQAITTRVTLKDDHQNRAFERFTEFGPVAVLPLSSSKGEHRASVVWVTSTEQARSLMALKSDTFVDQLQNTFGYRAGQFMTVGLRHCCSVDINYMTKPIQHRTVFIGNAAQTLHPIAGQGFNLGLRDISDLLTTIKQAIELSVATKSELDLGVSELSYRYLKLRELDREQTLTNVELLVRCFSNQYWPIVLGRNIGLRLLSWLPPLKSPIAHRAMGWRK